MSEAIPVRQRLFQFLARLQGGLRGVEPPGWSGTGEPSPVYETKTIRVHEPELGRYVYVMVTRFDGRGHILGEMGFGAVYFQFSVMSQNERFRLTRLSAYEIQRDHPVDWFPDANAFRLIKALDDGTVEWSSLSDGDRLTEGEVVALERGMELPLTCAYCDGGDDAYSHMEPARRERYGAWYFRDDGEPAHEGCSPRA